MNDICILILSICLSCLICSSIDLCQCPLYKCDQSKIYIDTRHKSSDSTSKTDFKIDLLVNISLHSNPAFYITYRTILVSCLHLKNEELMLYMLGLKNMLSLFNLV